MTIGLKRDDDDGDGDEEEEEKTTVRSVPDGSDNKMVEKFREINHGQILKPDRELSLHVENMTDFLDTYHVENFST